jgi:hypothetical protein
VILNLLPNGLAGFVQSSTRRLSLIFVAKINLEQKSRRGYPIVSVMKIISRIMIGSVLAAVLVAAFSTPCFAGPETRAKIKEDTKAAVEKTKEVAKEVAAETKEGR